VSYENKGLVHDVRDVREAHDRTQDSLLNLKVVFHSTREHNGTAVMMGEVMELSDLTATIIATTILIVTHL